LGFLCLKEDLLCPKSHLVPYCKCH
jgi:hypothetical protein